LWKMIIAIRIKSTESIRLALPSVSICSISVSHLLSRRRFLSPITRISLLFPFRFPLSVVKVRW
jgi:hypothetical protein